MAAALEPPAALALHQDQLQEVLQVLKDIAVEVKNAAAPRARIHRYDSSDSDSEDNNSSDSDSEGNNHADAAEEEALSAEEIERENIEARKRYNGKRCTNPNSRLPVPNQFPDYWVEHDRRCDSSAAYSGPDQPERRNERDWAATVCQYVHKVLTEQKYEDIKATFDLSRVELLEAVFGTERQLEWKEFSQVDFEFSGTSSFGHSSRYRMDDEIHGFLLADSPPTSHRNGSMDSRIR